MSLTVGGRRPVGCQIGCQRPGLSLVVEPVRLALRPDRSFDGQPSADGASRDQLARPCLTVDHKIVYIIHVADLVGIAEIAKLARVSRQAVSNWRTRYDDFPAPRASLRGGPVFSRSEVLAWLARTKGVEPILNLENPQPKPRRVLRHFLYLDEELVQEFLSQYEGGLYDEEERSTESRGAHGVSGKVGVGPLGLAGEAKKDAHQSEHRTTRQTSAGQFSRLYDYLDEDELIQRLPALDDAIWEQLESAELVEMPASIALPGLTKMVEIASGMLDILPMLQAFSASEISADPEGMEKMKAFVKMTSSDAGPISVIASVAASPRFQFLCSLKREWCRVPSASMEVEATILGKIQRKLGRGETVSAIEFFPGMNRLGRKQLREFERKLGNPQIPGMELGASSVRYPGAVLTPIGVFQ